MKPPDTYDFLGKARCAVFSALHRWEIPANGEEIPDLIQEAAANYYEQLIVDQQPPKLAFVRARARTPDYYYHALRGGRREYVTQTTILSIDSPILTNEDDTYHDLYPANDPDPAPDLTWIDDGDLAQVLVDAVTAHGMAGFRIRHYVANQLPLDILIIRLVVDGYINDQVAEILDVPVNTIKGRRQQIRRWLTALCTQRAIPLPDWQGGGARRAIDARCAYKEQRKSRPPASNGNPATSG